MPKNKIPHYRVDNPQQQEASKDKLEPCVKFVKDCFEEWDGYWGDRFNKFEEYYNRWKNKPPKRDEDWQSIFQKRLTWQAVATLTPRYYSTLFPISAPIEAEATETSDEVYRIIAKSIVSHWFKLGKFNKEFYSGIRSAAIYGTGLFEDDWYVKTGDVFEKVEKQIPDFRPLVDMNGNRIFDEQGNIRSEQIGTKTILTEEKRKKLIEDRYRLRKTSIFSWRIHPHKKDDDDDYPVIKQEFVNYDDLMKLEKSAQALGYSKFDNLDKLEVDKFKPDTQGLSRINKDMNYEDKDNPQIELLYYWGLYSEKEDGEKKPSWICIANRKYKLWVRDNPFWHQKSPLTHIVWSEDENEGYYGIGLAEIGADAEDRANVTVNIRIDERKKSVRSGGWYNANDKKIKKLELQKNIPGVWKSCSDVNASIKPDLPIPKSTLDDYKEEESAVNDHREITGATNSLLPPADKNALPDTLGGMQQNLNQALQRLKADLAMMEIMGIRRIANRAFLLTRQFMSLPQSIELIASDSQLKQFGLSKIYTMRPQMLTQGINFFCTGLSESIDKFQNIDKLLKFAEIAGKIPSMAQSINYQEIIKRIALWLGFEDADKIIQIMPMVQGLPQGAGQPIPGVMPMPPEGMPPAMPNMPMARPSMLPLSQGLPPQLLQMIAARMMQGQPNQAGVV